MKNSATLTRTILFVIVMVFLFTAATAQEKSYSFQKIKPDDFVSGLYKKDTSAVAVILADKGESYFDYYETKGFQLIFTRHLRLRIISKEGYEYATQSVTLYRSNKSSESISDIKGYTYNLVNGKVQEDKMTGSNIFEEQINQNWTRTTFTLPNVKAGSIIDIRYKITSDFIWNLREWEFQSTIPVEWSEYTVTIPEYYTFSRLLHGSVPFVISEIGSAPGSLTLSDKERTLTNLYNVQTKFEQTKINFSQGLYHFAVKDVPALKEEPYAPAMTNYISKVEFELKSTQFPGKELKNYTTSWQDICDELLLDEDFGGQLKKGRIVRDDAEMIAALHTSPEAKLTAAHALISSRMTWNGRNSLYPSTTYPLTTLREAYDKKTGNSADINLLLVLLLNELGLEATPVALSTRENGLLVESHPVMTQLNYVVAAVTLDGKTRLLDATTKDLPANSLPYKCLNGSGLLISKNKIQWVPLLGEEKESTLTHAEVKVEADGVIQGVFTISRSGFPARDVRSDYRKDGEEKYFTAVKKQFKEWKISGIKMENTDSLSLPVKEVLTISSEDVAQQNGNMIYFNTLLGLGITTNPFKAEKRENVVDFVCPVKDVHVCSIEIPEGYLVESMPETVKLLLPEQAGLFKFLVNVTGNKITVTSTLSISKTMFTAAEYSDLREFYQRVAAKHAQQIVLKKA